MQELDKLCAIRKLTAAPKNTVMYLKNRVQRKPELLDGKRVAALVVALDDEDFGVRENASKVLKRVGAAVAGTLQKAAAVAKSAEQRNRLEEILREYLLDDSGLTADQLRTLRVIRVLEGSHTTEAQGNPARTLQV